MRDALFFNKLRVLLCGWRWKQHRRASWLRAKLRRLRQHTQRASRSLTPASAQSRPATFQLESLEPRLLLAADLTGVVGATTLINPAVPTNSASAIVQVQNIGNQRVNQSQVGVYASLDTTLDSSDVLLGTTNTGQVNVGQSKNVTVNLTIPNTLDLRTYILLAKFDNANAITENSEANNVAIGGTIHVAWQFGNVPGRSGSTTLTLRDADGTNVTFRLSGPGLGEVIGDGANWDVKVTGTTASSAVTILTNGAGNGRVTLNDVHVFGPLAAFTAATTNLTGTLAIDGPVTIPGVLPGTITLGSIQNGTVAVPSVEALTILGSTTGATFLIGTTLGRDGQQGGSDDNADTYGPGRIGLFTVTGAMTGTTVRVGINPVDGIYGNGNDQLIGGTASSIGGIVIGGSLSNDTRFIAGAFPTQYLHGVTLKPTAGDFNFISNFSGPSLSAALQQDTGSSVLDKVTNNPVIIGSVTDPQGIATFVAGFGATPTFNILPDRQSGGSFTLSRQRLGQIDGIGLLADGPYTLTLRATDTAGNSTQMALAFTFDTQVPVLILDLDPSSDDTAPVGDQQTTEVIVTLVGQTEANAQVELVEPGRTTTADGAGAYSFSNVVLPLLGANTFTARATDAAGNARTEARTITRIAANSAPVFNMIFNYTVDEGQVLTFTAAATDEDLPAQELIFSLANGAEGQVPVAAMIAPTTGVFTWTPTEAQGPGTYTFDVVVSDGALNDRATVTVIVNEVNQAPILFGILPTQSARVGQPLTFTAGAADIDLPTDTLTYSLQGTVPAGAAINAVTGLFTWTPEEVQIGQHTLTVRVTDNGTPTLFMEQQVTVNVTYDVVTAQWISPMSGSWFDASNWSTGFMPDANTNVVIPSTGDSIVEITGSAVARSVQSSGRVLIRDTGILTVGTTYTNNDEIVFAYNSFTASSVGRLVVQNLVNNAGGGIGFDRAGLIEAQTFVNNGTLSSVFGFFSEPGTESPIIRMTGVTSLENNGSILVGSSGPFTLEGGLHNTGLVELEQSVVGELDVRGAVVNGASGRIELNGGTITVGVPPANPEDPLTGSFTNHGTVWQFGTGSLIIHGDVLNDVRNVGTPAVAGGSFLLDSGTLSVGGTFENRWQLDMMAGQVTVGGDLVNVGGGAFGQIFFHDQTLTVNGNVSNSGELILSTGQLVADGDFAGTSAGLISIEMAGDNQFGNLQIAGTLNVDNRFAAQLINGYTPAVGQTFTVFTFGTPVPISRPNFAGGVFLSPGLGSHFSGPNDFGLIAL